MPTLITWWDGLEEQMEEHVWRVGSMGEDEGSWLPVLSPRSTSWRSTGESTTINSMALLTARHRLPRAHNDSPSSSS